MFNYILVTGAYWGFTLTDGALRMLVLLHFYSLGYSPFTIALLFLLYEFFGVVTNLLGGWIGQHYGLRLTLTTGLLLQVVALVGLAQVSDGWSEVVSVSFVMAMQALSGIAKDLTKMSSKSAVKLLVREGDEAGLFKWVALLTGSKNTLKGVGFFLGGVLLNTLGFAHSLYAMAAALALILVGIKLSLKQELGSTSSKVKFSQLFSRSREINLLSAARVFLFGARDIWFVVGLPVYLSAVMGWSETEIGSFMAAWVIFYGIVQGSAPRFIRQRISQAPQGHTARFWVQVLVIITAILTISVNTPHGDWILLIGLAVFGGVFAINSSVHSYLVLAYTKKEHVAVNVGFYYMANAVGRLLGTLLSGLSYQWNGIEGCLGLSAVFLFIAWIFSRKLSNLA